MLAGQTTSKMVQSHQLHPSSSQPLEPAIPQKGPRMLMASLLNHSFLPQLALLLHCPAGERVPSFQGTTGTTVCSQLWLRALQQIIC